MRAIKHVACKPWPHSNAIQFGFKFEFEHGSIQIGHMIVVVPSIDFMHPLRAKFVDHVLFVSLPIEISCTAVAIVDTLDDSGKTDAQCVAALFIAWKFHSNSHDHTIQSFAKIAVPTRGTFSVTGAQLRQSEKSVLKALMGHPADNRCRYPQVKPIYRQFVSRAVVHALKHVNQRTDVYCLAWAVVYYACFISGGMLRHTDFDMRPCRHSCKMIRVLLVLFKNDPLLCYDSR